MTTETWSTSQTLTCAAAIAARAERRGKVMSAAEALERATAAELHLRHFAALREQYPGVLDDTVPCPELPAGVSIAA